MIHKHKDKMEAEIKRMAKRIKHELCQLIRVHMYVYIETFPHDHEIKIS